MRKHSLSRLSIRNIPNQDRFVENLGLLNESTDNQWRTFLTDVCPEGYDNQTTREWRVKVEWDGEINIFLDVDVSKYDISMDVGVGK